MKRLLVLLFLVAVIGGIITIYLYKNEPKIYASYASITVRTENMEMDFARKFVNRGMRNLNSNEEMMLIINELDLFPSTRAAMPYTIALRRMRRELIIKNSQGQIEVIFESKDPRESQRVVAFVVERQCDHSALNDAVPVLQQTNAFSGVFVVVVAFVRLCLLSAFTFF